MVGRFPMVTKVAAIGLVIVLLAVVLARIEGLVLERQNRHGQAAAGIESNWAEPQTLLGPLLHRRCTEVWDGKDGATERREFALTLAPQALTANAELRAEARYRGLYKVNGYVAAVTLQARWPSTGGLQPVRERANSRLACGPATLLVAPTDVRGVRSATVAIDGAARTVLPGTGHAIYAHGLQVPVDDERLTSLQPLAATVTLELLGSGRFDAVPAAAQTAWTVKSDWPHPSFGGRFLPLARTITKSGFDARWTVSGLGSAAAADVAAGVALCRPPRASGAIDGDAPSTQSDGAKRCLETLGVAFIDPVNPYLMSERAVKYGLLFVFLTFGSVAAAEIVGRRRVHPMQYALVGLALALFFLLLLSLSEHIAFGYAYIAASTACVALLAFYGRHMLDSWRAGGLFGAGIAVLYAALWTLLQMEQAALVIGSLLLFGVLAVVMVLTRRVDWYTLVRPVSGVRDPTDTPASS